MPTYHRPIARYLLANVSRTISFLSRFFNIGRRRRSRHSRPKGGRPRANMGNEASTPVDESTPPRVLERRDVESLAKYILERDVRSIVVMVGFPHSLSEMNC